MSERLTNEELANVLRWCAPDSEHDYVRDMATELRERRAADLTAEDREALEWLRERHLAENNPNNIWTIQAVAVLTRLLNGGK